MFEQIDPPKSEEKCFRVTADCSCKMIMEIWAKDEEEAKELANEWGHNEFDVEMIDTNIEDILKVEEIED